MITIAVASVLVAAALPSFGRFVRDQRVKTATTDVYASIVYARSEAIKRGADVQVVPAAGTTNWAQGWTVRVVTGGDTLRIQDAISGVTLTGPATLTYRRDGRLSGTAVSLFNLSAPNDATVSTRCVRVDPSGRPNIKVGC